jgi:hypothetical protein
MAIETVGRRFALRASLRPQLDLCLVVWLSGERRLELDRGSVAVMKGGERNEMCSYMGVPTRFL